MKLSKLISELQKLDGDLDVSLDYYAEYNACANCVRGEMSDCDTYGCVEENNGGIKKETVYLWNCNDGTSVTNIVIEK